MREPDATWDPSGHGAVPVGPAEPGPAGVTGPAPVWGPSGVAGPAAAWEPAGAAGPTAGPTGVLFPELLVAPEPAPPARPRGARLLKGLARVLLWSLITVGAARGLLPDRGGPTATGAVRGLLPGHSGSTAIGAAAPGQPSTVPAESPERDRAEAVAAAFLREYLTVGEDRAARAKRLGDLTVRGVDLRRSVDVPAGVTQYADLVVPAGSRSVAGGVAVTVVAHVLQARSDGYRDGGTLAFVVPLAVQRGRIGVTGRPRPTAVPVGPRLSLPRPAAAPPSMSQLAGRIAHQAVVALVTGDQAALARLGGGRPPSTRRLPPGWRAISVGPAEVTGPAEALAAEVPVRARPPTGPVSYTLPVQVQLKAGARGITVRRIDGGGSP
jgi:hypothetical protein